MRETARVVINSSRSLEVQMDKLPQIVQVCNLTDGPAEAVLIRQKPGKIATGPCQTADGQRSPIIAEFTFH